MLFWHNFALLFLLLTHTDAEGVVGDPSNPLFGRASSEHGEVVQPRRQVDPRRPEDIPVRNPLFDSSPSREVGPAPCGSACRHDALIIE